MKKIKILNVILFMFMFIGCATIGGQTEWYEAQKDYVLSLQSAPQNPLFEMKALPGTSIQNLESLKVFPAPFAPKELKQYIETPHPGWDVLKTGLRSAGQIGFAYVIGEAAVDFIGAVTRTTGNTSISGTGNTLNYGSIDSTSVPTVVNQPTPIIVE